MNIDHDLLSRSEEIYLLEKSKQGCQDATEKLITHNQRLVAKIAYRFFLSRRCGDLELEDLIQFGNMGLYEAIKRFDLSRHVRFSTYATYWVRQFIMRHGGKTGIVYGITYTTSQKMVTVRASVARLQQRYHRDPTQEEIALENGISMEELQEINGLYERIVRLDDQVGGDDSGSKEELHQFIPDPNYLDAQEIAETEDQNSVLVGEVRKLPPKWIKIIYLKYQKGYTTADIARRMKVSHTRIQQIENELTVRLQVALRKKIDY